MVSKIANDCYVSNPTLFFIMRETMTELRFQTHKEVPVHYRRGILDFSGENRIHKVDIEEVNRICDEIDYFKEVNAEQLKYEIHHASDGEPTQTIIVEGYEQAALTMDRVTDFGESRSVTAVMVQNGRPVRGFEKGTFIEDQTSIYAGMGHGIGEAVVYA